MTLALTIQNMPEHPTLTGEQQALARTGWDYKRQYATTISYNQLTDYLGWDDPGINNPKYARTPNLDR
jgi:hypothetical protein